MSFIWRRRPAADPVGPDKILSRFQLDLKVFIQFGGVVESGLVLYFGFVLNTSQNIVWRTIYKHVGVSTNLQTDFLFTTQLFAQNYKALLWQPHANLDQGTYHQILISRCWTRFQAGSTGCLVSIALRGCWRLHILLWLRSLSVRHFRGLLISTSCYCKRTWWQWDLHYLQRRLASSSMANTRSQLVVHSVWSIGTTCCHDNTQRTYIWYAYSICMAVVSACSSFRLSGRCLWTL